MFPVGHVCAVLTCWDCRFIMAELGAGCWGEMAGSFSQGRHSLGLCWSWSHVVSRLGDVCKLSTFMGLVCCRVQFNLIHNLLLFAKKETKKKGRNNLRPRQTHPSGYAVPGCYVQLKGSVLEFYGHICGGSNLFH
jgi:hypothetical protein